MLNPDLIVPYDSTHASIPTNFTRETQLDGLYPKGAPNATNPGTTGGNATHSHTSPGHTHTLAGHQHDITTNSVAHYLEAVNGSDSGGGPIGREVHYHTGTTDTVTSASIGSVTVTYGSYSNHPPYYEVIFIKATNYVLIPNNALILSANDSRTDMSFHTASANRYLKGAGTGADAGGTGGSLTNAHTIDHVHSTSHGHTGTSGNNIGGSISRQSGANLPASMGNHTHPMTLSAQALDSASNSSIGSQSETVEPAYRTLSAYKNTSGGGLVTRPGDIALFLGTIANIPVGWFICDGTNGTPDMRDRFMKVPASAATSSAAGSNTHTHAAQAHTHTLAAHTHTGSIGAAAQTISRKASGDMGDVWGGAEAFHPQHSISSVSSVGDTLQSSNTTADSSDNQPPYRTALYLQFQYESGGGLLPLLLA